MYEAQVFLASWTPVGLREAKNAYFSLSTQTKQLLLVTFCDTTAGIGVTSWTDRKGNEWTDRREG